MQHAPLSPAWPVLSSRSGAQLERLAMGIGGIGTGTIGLAGHGALVDWEITNRPNKGHAPRIGDHLGPALIVRAQAEGGVAMGSLLEGPLPNRLIEDWHGCSAPHAGLPRFRSSTFHSAYPLAQVALRDESFPLQADLLAFNPLIPGDSEASGLPVVMLRVRLHNPGVTPIQATVALVLPNIIGDDSDYRRGNGTHEPRPDTGGRNRVVNSDSLHGICLDATAIDPTAANAGEMVIACPRNLDATWRTAWDAQQSWSTPMRRFWADLMDDGRIAEPSDPDRGSHPIATLAPTITIPPGETRDIPLIIAWRFPNRRAWEHWQHEGSLDLYPRIGNHYARTFSSALAAAEYAMEHWQGLEDRTVSFVTSVVTSDIPRPLAEAALSNLSTLRSPTVFRDEDGNPFAWEGTRDRAGSCHGNCLHVWNYEHAVPFLFPDLARRFRDLEFIHAIDPAGALSFRINLPLTIAKSNVHAAADGHMGTIVRAWREWSLSGNDVWLKKHWPAIRKAIAFAWEPGSWDADQDGVMEGCQHNTMDVEYYGPNVQMTGWYLAALAAGERLASHLGEHDFAGRCASLRAKGSAWVDSHLFNGEFYIQEIRPPKTIEDIHPSTRGFGMGAKDLTHPDFQLGEACLIDQTVGQTVASLYGLGDLLDPDHCRSACASVWQYNRRESFFRHVNPLRSFALNDERAVLMASYPTGNRPDIPFPYADEVMTGFEYTVALHMLQLDMHDEALTIINDIRSRHDGIRRNPFDEIECGRHYSRALASWGLIPAWTGFHYEAHNGQMQFRDQLGRWPWCVAGAWGHCTITTEQITLQVLGGSLRLKTLTVGAQVWEISGADATWELQRESVAVRS